MQKCDVENSVSEHGQAFITIRKATHSSRIGARVGGLERLPTERRIFESVSDDVLDTLNLRGLHCRHVRGLSGACSREPEQTIRLVTKDVVDGDEEILDYIDEGSIAYTDVVPVLVDIRSVTWNGDFLRRQGADVLR